jgi:biofilm PGA synthesis N-glycosyltransferase PgaC
LVQTELFVTIDADTELAPDAVYEAMRYFNDPSCEVVCGTVIPQIRDTFWERGRLVEYLYAQNVMKPAQNHHGLVLVASGCFSIFKTGTVRDFGGFNERTLAEDMDLTWEIQNRGDRVYYAPKAVCYPIDPSDGKTYINQLDRWYRGFMQNIKVRNFRLFPDKRPMAFMVYGYVIWFAISALLIPGFIFVITGNLLYAIGFALLINAVFVWLPSLLMAYRIGVFKDAVKGLIPFLLLPYLNLFLYCRAAVRELILGQTLTVWKKGH